jgi:signal peptidase I
MFRYGTWWKYALVIACVILVLVFIRLSVIAAYKTPSASMENILLIGDRILVLKSAYGIKIPFTSLRILNFHKPAVGDVVVFKPPQTAGNTQKFIKRIVGIQGDIIEIKEGELYRNGVAVIGEDYVKRQPFSKASSMNMHPLKVPPDHVFVMGDNRDRSNDSRMWGAVPIGNIEGQVFIIYWSWDKSRIGRRIK